MLEVENLEVVYGRVIVAVQGVSLKVPDNSIVALLGTNGAGKSTTVRAISGFLPVDDAVIRKGAIRFRGQSILGSPPYDTARRRFGAGAAQDFRDAHGRGEHANLAARRWRWVGDGRHRQPIRDIPGSGSTSEADIRLS